MKRRDAACHDRKTCCGENPRLAANPEDAVLPSSVCADAVRQNGASYGVFYTLWRDFPPLSSTFLHLQSNYRRFSQ